MKGIPTVYAGTRFRSRLEARWAYMFDALGWQWEYEPFDLPGWIPDFIVMGGREFLVEIKPCTSLCELGTVACNTPNDHRDVVCFGCSAFPHGSDEWNPWPAGVLIQPSRNSWVTVEWCICCECDRVALYHGTERDGDWDYGLSPCGHDSANHVFGVYDTAAAAWARAANATQWRGGLS